MGDGISAAWVIGVGGVVTAVVSPLFSYLLARRASSGRVSTSDAVLLWGEAQKIRDFLNAELSELREEMNEARKEIMSLTRAVGEREASIAALKARLDERSDILSQLKEVSRLLATVASPPGYNSPGEG